MHDRPYGNGKALSLLIVGLIALSGVAVLLGATSAPGHAATCDQGGTTITGDWTVTSVQYCVGIPYTVDGSITVASGGSLTIVNGGLTFAKDMAHTSYALTVNAGGTLILDNSYVTVETTAIQPYLKLALTVGGTFTMQNGAYLKFPGWFNATGATITLSDSTITGFLPGDLTGVGVYVGDNDNSPLISWSSTTASLYRSQIARIYENTTSGDKVNATGPVQGNVALTTNSNLYAYDSYIGVDYSNYGVGTTCPCLHNELTVDGNSNAFLYNVTIDRTEDPVSETNWQPAFVPTVAGGSIYFFRWLQAHVVDSTNFPVSNAGIWSAASPFALTAQYPDNGMSTTPSARTLTYLGRTSSGVTAWNRTDLNGNAQIPLYTDQITTQSLPNAFSFGSYQLVVSFGTASVQSGVGFHPYPALSAMDNNAWVTIPMSSVQVRTGPDLALRATDYTNQPYTPVLVGQAFKVYAPIYNQGQTNASGVDIAAYLDGNLSDQHARVNGLSVAFGSSVNVTLNVTAISTPGAHTLELIVDPDHTIPEGGVLQESNNFANVTLNVQPPPEGFVAIGTPQVGLTVEPGASVSVTGVVRDTKANPIPGVLVTIALMSGSNTLATTSTTSALDGTFQASLTVPPGTADGTYTVEVTSSASTISGDSTTITVRAPASFLNTPVPLIGLQWWLFLIILAAVVVAAIGITLYFKVYGIGKMVECGECGSFIPEDATVCPKCGVEFEKDMAKCSNCGSWIPVDVKQCPECGVEFATGEMDMAGYQERMRLQYDEVVQKLREDASRQLGRALSDKEFQEWWRRQPSFVTFEDWLHEEEDMRKQGSKACPICGTLNSVTAKVCHKCGSLMRGTAPAGQGTVKVGAPKKVAARPAAPAAPAETPPPPQAGPVVQKKIIKRTPGEGESGEGEQSSEDNQDL